MIKAQKIELPGVPNLWQVAEGLYRSGRPTINEAWEALLYPTDLTKRTYGTLGIKTVINLEYFHLEKVPDNPNVNFIRIPMVAWWPETEDVVAFLKVLKTAERPILWHCLQGSDRTGFMTAYYRIIMEGWTKEQAIEEMKMPQFGYHGVFDCLIDDIEKVDIDKIKEAIK